MQLIGVAYIPTYHMRGVYVATHRMLVGLII
jgi:hypothetical protein